MDALRRLRLVVIAVATLAAIAVPVPSALAAPVIGQPCPDSGYTGSTPSSDGQSASARPVILVHGWTGGRMSGTATQLQQMLGDRISTFTFDYSRWASHWATDVHIASCLADYVSSVSSAYRSAGGDGKVLMVAHSMGGLAIRYALDPRFAKNPVPAGTIASVVTLSTPYGGSPYGGSAFARFKEVAGHYLGGTDLPGTGAGDGGACLAEHSGSHVLPDACGGAFAPYYAAGVPVTQIAGSVSVNRTIFGFTAYSLPLGGDSIVPVSSSQGYLMGGPDATTPHGQHAFMGTDDCSIDQDVTRIVADPDIIAGLSKALAIEKLDTMTLDELDSNRLGPLEMAQDAFGLLADCSHIHISTDDAALQQVADALQTTLQQLSPGLPAGAVRLSDVRTDWSGDGPSGDPVSVRIGGRTEDQSTTQWMGCYDSPAWADYDLQGHTRLTGDLSLRDFAPTDLQVEVGVLVDGQVVKQFTLGQTPIPVDLRLPPGSQLRLQAQRVGGSCNSASEGDVVWGNGALA